jgi:uncharacterized Zn-finger protein
MKKFVAFCLLILASRLLAMESSSRLNINLDDLQYDMRDFLTDRLEENPRPAEISQTEPNPSMQETLSSDFAQFSYTCSFKCGYTTDFKANLDAHEKMHILILKCPYISCRFTTLVEDKLKKHISIHKDKKFACVHNCGYATNEEDKLTRHELTHDGHKAFRCEEADCPYECDSHADLIKHERTHSQERPFICEYCQVSFGRKDTMDNHISRVHIEARAFKCAVKGCTYAAKTNGDLKRHAIKHIEKNPYACTFAGCDFTCKRGQILQEHLAIHTGINPQQCSVPGCTYITKNKALMTEHLNQHLIDSYSSERTLISCTVPDCEFSTSDSTAMEAHFTEHLRKLYNPDK